MHGAQSTDLEDQETPHATTVYSIPFPRMHWATFDIRLSELLYPPLDPSAYAPRARFP
jgi:hypothetical protein